jgi:hypothetical protein
MFEIVFENSLLTQFLVRNLISEVHKNHEKNVSFQMSEIINSEIIKSL